MPDKKTTNTRISELLAEKDAHANQLKKEYQFYWKNGLHCAVAAAIIFAVSTSLDSEFLPDPLPFILTVMETLFLIAAGTIVLLVNNKKIKLQRTRIRVESERLRAMESLVHGGIPVKKLHAFRNPADQQNIEDNSMDARITALEEELIEEYKTIKDHAHAEKKLRELIVGQIEYHKGPNRILKFEKKLETAEKWLKYLRWIFYAGVFFHLYTAAINQWESLNFWHLENYFHEFGLLFCTVVPPIYAWIEGHKYFEEWERFLGESLIMAEYFEVQLQKLDEHPTDLVEFAHGIREVMDRENRSWKMLMEFKTLNGI